VERDDENGPSVSEHPRAEILASYADNLLSPGEKIRIEAHLAICAECRATLALATEHDYRDKDSRCE
jgi:anti-sigma factor ChrR (cupin superfamily)